MRLLIAFTLLALLGGCRQDTCSPRKLADLAKRIDAAGPGERGAIVAEGLPRACRIDRPIEGFFFMMTLPPFASEDMPTPPLDLDSDVEPTLWAKMDTSAEYVRSAVPAICEDISDIRPDLAQLGRPERAGMFYDRCNFARFDVVDRAEWVEGEHLTGLPIYAYVWLDKRGATQAQARSIARAMLELERHRSFR